MFDAEQSPHRGFDAGKQLSMVVFGCGVLLLLGHLAGQMRVGSASGWSLLVGAGCLLAGLVGTLLFSILIRLDRIERRLHQPGSVSANTDDEDELGERT